MPSPQRQHCVLLALACLLQLVNAWAPSASRVLVPRTVTSAFQRQPVILCGLRDIPLIANQEDYEALIESATKENRVVVIKFFASWCRACKAMAPKYSRITDDWPDIEFHEIMFDNNKVSIDDLLYSGPAPELHHTSL